MTRKLPDYYSKNTTDSTDYHGFKKIIRGIREIRGVLFLLDRHPAGCLDWRAKSVCCMGLFICFFKEDE
jgi:hypothetical protein